MRGGGRRRSAWIAVVGAGAGAGLFGGFSMWIFLTIIAAWRGLGWLTPAQAFAGVFLRGGAIGGGVGAALLGLCIHAAVSIGLAVAFTAIALRRTAALESVVAGIGLATVAWAVMTFVVVPLTNPTLRAFTRDLPFAWFASHVVFGMAAASARQFHDWLAADLEEVRGPAVEEREPRTGAPGRPPAARDDRREGGARSRVRRALHVAARLATLLAVAAASIVAARAQNTSPRPR